MNFNERVLDLPLRWKRPRRIFVNSMSDLFHENVPDETRDRIFAVMGFASQHTFQVLTKRPEQMRAYMAALEDDAWRLPAALEGIVEARKISDAFMDAEWPLPNVWLGVSVEHQAAADERIPLLLQTPAAVRFLSCEPLLGPINFRWAPYAHQAMGQTHRQYLEERGQINEYESLRQIDWVIAGGESGPGARPMHPAWARSLRDQCTAANVPFFFKQWGEWAPADDFASEVQEHYDVLGRTSGASIRIGKKRAGHLLDGAEHYAFPETSACSN